LKIFLVDFGGILAGAVILAIGLQYVYGSEHARSRWYQRSGSSSFYLIKSPVGLTIIVLNIPLFIAGYLYSAPIVMQSLLGTFYSRLLLKLLRPFCRQQQMISCLASVYGGVVMGVGSGLVFRFRGSTGGTSLLSLILAKKWGISPVRLCFGAILQC
jgi:uncharacterized membrane-anchored protein YitT (DUF2179 family)